MKKLLYHPESDSYLEVEEAELPALFASADGALCVETVAAVAVLPPMPAYTVVAAEAVVAQVDAQEQAMGDAPVIADQGSLNAVKTVVKNAKQVWNTIDAERQRVKAPFLEACKKIDAAARPLLERLQAVMDEGKRQQGEFLIERDRQLAEQERLRKEAEMLATLDTSRPTAPLVALTLPDPIAAPLTAKRVVKVVDEAKIPRHYYVLDRRRLEADALAGITVPGVEVVTESIITAR